MQTQVETSTERNDKPVSDMFACSWGLLPEAVIIKTTDVRLGNDQNHYYVLQMQLSVLRPKAPEHFV